VISVKPRPTPTFADPKTIVPPFTLASKRRLIPFRADHIKYPAPTQ